MRPPMSTMALAMASSSNSGGSAFSMSPSCVPSIRSWRLAPSSITYLRTVPRAGDFFAHRLPAGSRSGTWKVARRADASVEPVFVPFRIIGVLR